MQTPSKENMNLFGDEDWGKNSFADDLSSSLFGHGLIAKSSHKQQPQTGSSENKRKRGTSETSSAFRQPGSKKIEKQSKHLVTKQRKRQKQEMTTVDEKNQVNRDRVKSQGPQSREHKLKSDKELTQKKVKLTLNKGQLGNCDTQNVVHQKKTAAKQGIRSTESQKDVDNSEKRVKGEGSGRNVSKLHWAEIIHVAEKPCCLPVNKEGNSTSLAPKTKRRKNRKKKNNSKNNKYKHLDVGDKDARVSGDSSKDIAEMDQSQEETSTKTRESQAKCLHEHTSNHNGLKKKILSHHIDGPKPCLDKTGQSRRHKKRKMGLEAREGSRMSKPKKHQGVREHDSDPLAGRRKMHDDDDATFDDHDDDATDDDSYSFPSGSEEIESETCNDSGSSRNVETKINAVNRETGAVVQAKKPSKLSSFLDKAREKLDTARFRFLNEQLYTSTGKEALAMFSEDTESFEIYHKGFQAQVSRWPVNPLSIIVQQLKNKPACKVIADFGCGDAQLAESLPQRTIHSFDLVALKPCVTVCDMSKVPLPSVSVDAAVFCLSLMGTNLEDYLCEANRVLKTRGLLLVAEVVSRFQGVNSFVSKVEQLGFALMKKTMVSKMFYIFVFKKEKSTNSKFAPSVTLKPCYYKRR